MKDLVTRTKIVKFGEKVLEKNIKKWLEHLKQGDLYEFEKDLNNKLKDYYNHISKELLEKASKELNPTLKKAYKKQGCKKAELRSLQIRLSTGYVVKVKSYYAKEVPKDWNLSRHFLSIHWKIIDNASPSLYDKIGYCSVLCPSYNLGHQTLSKFGVELSLSKVQRTTKALAIACNKYKEEELMLEAGESLKGKRVVLSIDGGRTRIREYRKKKNANGNLTYETKWMEPKLFVIDVLNKEGKPDRYELPIYGCRFGESDMFELLEGYLKKLEIDKASSVQIIADGAAWIWKHTKKKLLSLGVAEDSIIETLDYYHATEYVNDLVDKMPKRVNKKKRKEYKKQFKDLLWNGKSTKIVEECKKIYKRPSKIIKRWLNYLDKHNSKTQYAHYQSNNLMCGSGIIESAIRRIINLRFKNASTFWYPENVEKMFFLRAALLSKRWEIVIQNLVA